MHEARVEFVYSTPYIDPDYNELKALQHVKVSGLIPSEEVWQQHEPIVRRSSKISKQAETRSQGEDNKNIFSEIGIRGNDRSLIHSFQESKIPREKNIVMIFKHKLTRLVLENRIKSSGCNYS